MRALKLSRCEATTTTGVWLVCECAARSSGTRSRLPLELHEQVFTWVLHRLSEHGLIKGERIGVDASTLEANAALRSIVRRDSGEGYREILTRMAKESGIATPTADDLVRLDRARTGKKAVECRLGRTPTGKAPSIRTRRSPS